MTWTRTRSLAIRLARQSGIGEEIAEALVKAGFKTPADIKAATDRELVDVEGVGRATLPQIRVAFPKA